MTQTQWTLSQTEQFDEIIDVRSPQEYACDHIPSAANYPVLDDAQRAHIGYIHKQVSPFEARKQGASLVATNIAQHIEQHFATRTKAWRPLIYCWRGGMRSAAMTHILNSIGWRSEQLPGGYKTYRRAVIDALEQIAPQAHFIVLCGRTGVGKSRLLAALRASNAQVLDLEGLANHRGSILGEPTTGAQPSQKWFESIVCGALRHFDLNLPVYVEAESRKIGRVQLPDALVSAIRDAQCIRVEATVEQRVAFLISEYHHFMEQPSRFMASLEKLKPYIGYAQADEWHRAFERGQIADVVAGLIDKHYDPFYLRSMEKHFSRYTDAQCIQLTDLTEAGFAKSAEAIKTLSSHHSSA